MGDVLNRRRCLPFEENRAIQGTTCGERAFLHTGYGFKEDGAHPRLSHRALHRV